MNCTLKLFGFEPYRLKKHAQWLGQMLLLWMKSMSSICPH